MMAFVSIPGLKDFLSDYPLMSMKPAEKDFIKLTGKFEFVALHHSIQIHDTFDLEILVRQNFPQELPTISEVGGRIPRFGEFHVNSDGTLCLGSPLRLLMVLQKKPDLIGFSELCLIPYLYAISRKLTDGSKLVFDELRHGKEGILEDYLDIFSLRNHHQVQLAINLLGLKKRLANKQPCPCECGKRLGKCKFNIKIEMLRKLANRSWFRAQNFTINKRSLVN